MIDVRIWKGFIGFLRILRNLEIKEKLRFLEKNKGFGLIRELWNF
jgi:hypothetical protein